MSEIETSGSLPLTEKGLATREKLLETAEELFGTKGFFSTSVVEITREAGVAQGTFYNYFSSKEEIFQEFFEKLIGSFLSQLQEETAKASSIKEEVMIKYRFYLKWVKNCHNLYSLIDQSLHVNEELYRWFYEKAVSHHIKGLQKEVESGRFKQLDVETLAYCLTGIYGFIGWRWGHSEKEVPENILADIFEFIFHGLATDRRAKSKFMGNSFDTLPLTQKYTETKQKLLEVAEEIFGAKGYYNTSIVDITRQAGLGQGTFYVHFSSKQDCFNELMRKLCCDFLTNLQKETEKAETAKEELMIRFRFSFHWIKNHRNLFINPELYLWFYKTAVDSFFAGLQAGIKSREFKKLDAEAIAYCLIGITTFVGWRWVYLEDKEIPDNILNDIYEFVFAGIEQKS